MSLTPKTRSGKVVRSLTAVALATVGLVATASASNAVTTVLTMTPSSTTGPAGGTNTLVLTLTAPATATASNKFASGAGAFSIQFQNVPAGASSPVCAVSGAMTGTITASNFFVNPAVGGTRYISPTRATVLVPANPTAVQNSITPTNSWLICAYNSASENIGKATYTTAPAPTITTLGAAVGSLSAIVGFTGSAPAVTGSSTGGTELAIHGANLPTTLTGGNSILLGASTSTAFSSNGAANGTVTGGTAVASIKASPAPTATDITVVLPAKVGANQSITVVTPGGSYTVGFAFSSINGIVVSPNAVKTGGTVDIDITGAGFLGSAFSFSNTGSAGAGAVSGQDDGTSHVFLVDGVYDPTGYIGATDIATAAALPTPVTLTAAAKTNAQVAECVDVFVISDAELICTLNSTKKAAWNSGTGAWTYPSTAIPLGAYTLVVVDKADVNSVAANRTAVSAGSTFTVAQFV